MATDKRLVSFYADKDPLDRGEGFWHRRKFANVADGIRRLIMAERDAKLAPMGE
jgi:hypothetical protein